MHRLNKTILLFIFCLQAIIGCKREGVTITFDISDSFDFTLRSGSIINLPIDILTPNISTNSANEFDQNDTRADKIKEIKLTELKLSITSPPGKTFSFLKSAEIFISADGLPEKLVASAFNIQSSDARLNLNCSLENFAEYIKQPNYTVRAKTVTRETINQDININCFLSFKVKAAPLK